MRLLALAIVLAAAMPAQAPPPDASAILTGVEKRYNNISTLQAAFTYTFRDRGRARLPKSGTLYLSKPGRTRWEYTGPDEGDFFLSDGKFTYEYDKKTNSVDRQPFKQSEDQRIPLSFLLGRLDFQKDFERFEAKADGISTVISLIPRNKNLLFKDIVMTVAPDSSIRQVAINGQEGSVMEYALSGEQRNVKLPDTLFKFTPPPGAQVADVR